MKKSRRDRKMFNEGKQVGYIEGYKQGLHDGNPFNALSEACIKMAETIRQTLTDPKVMQMIEEMNRTEREELIIEGNDDEVYGDN